MVLKNLLFTAALAGLAIQAQAQITSGYYRVQNADTKRYATLVDNRAYQNVAATDVDLTAIKTVTGLETVISDPGSVLYINSISDGYNLIGQGKDTYSMVGVGIKFITTSVKTPGAYKAYSSKAGLTLYLCDTEDFMHPDWNYMGTASRRTADDTDWFLHPVDNTTNNYFGITPTLTINGEQYATLYASFPFKLASEGMKAYYVSETTSKGNSAFAKLVEITSSEIPGSTPVIIKCAGDNAAANKIELVAPQNGSQAGNKLSGTFFCNDVTGNHRNVIDYKSETMRVLGTTAEGKLGFVTSSSLTYIPANTAYLTVASNFPADVTLVDEANWAEATSITDVKADDNLQEAGVYTLTGVKVRDNNSTDGLAKGLYIVGGKTIVVK